MSTDRRRLIIVIETNRSLGPNTSHESRLRSSDGSVERILGYCPTFNWGRHLSPRSRRRVQYETWPGRRYPSRIVFDTEPLVAHADDESGSDTVEEYLNALAAEETDGYVNRVNLTEVRYVLARKYDRMVADTYIEWLLDLGIQPIDVDALWRKAADYVISYNPALGDSFGLATAEHFSATILVGADTEYEAITEVPIERFRDAPA